jgi:hypothetical protein
MCSVGPIHQVNAFLGGAQSRPHCVCHVQENGFKTANRMFFLAIPPGVFVSAAKGSAGKAASKCDLFICIRWSRLISTLVGDIVAGATCMHVDVAAAFQRPPTLASNAILQLSTRIKLNAHSMTTLCLQEWLDARHRREAVWQGPRLEPPARQGPEGGARRGPDLPHRPLPRQGAHREPDRAALREPHL